MQSANQIAIEQASYLEFLFDPKLLTLGAVVVVLVGVATILITVEKGVSIWHKVKREPPIEQTLAQLVKKPDLLRTEETLKAEIASGDERLREEINEVDERQTAEVRAMRSYNSKATGEIFNLIRNQSEKTSGEIGKLTASINKEFTTLNRELGELKGEIRATRPNNN